MLGLGRNPLSGRSIVVVCSLWERVVRVRFSAPRQRSPPEARGASVEISSRDLSGPGSIPGTPTLGLTESPGDFCGNFSKKFEWSGPTRQNFCLAKT